jgi:biotin synthase
MGFAAGANVITVNVTPAHAQASYPIYGADRFVVGQAYAMQVLEAAGLKSGRA